MAKFIYKMQNILDMRYKVEDQAKTAFATAANKVREEEEKYQALLRRKEELEDEYRDAISGRIDSKELNVLLVGIDKIRGDLKAQGNNIKVANKNLDTARIRLEDAIKERKVQDKLKEKAFDEFKVELNEQEKKEVDELVSYRFGNK